MSNLKVIKSRVNLLGGFDRDWYREQYGISESEDEIEHYKSTGWQRLYDPSPKVSTALMLARSSSIYPLTAFLSSFNNSKESYISTNSAILSFNISSTNDLSEKSKVLLSDLARKTLLSGKFNPLEYLKKYPDLKKSGINVLWHFIKFGISEGRDPSASFQTKNYKKIFMADSTEFPFVHYLKNYALLGDNKNKINDYKIDIEKEYWSVNKIARSEFFNLDWFTEKYEELISNEKISPLVFFYRYANDLGLDPSESFSTANYLAKYSDVKDAECNALLHFLEFGKKEGRINNLGHDFINGFPKEYPRQKARVLDITKVMNPLLGSWDITSHRKVKRAFSYSDILNIKKPKSRHLLHDHKTSVIGAATVILRGNEEIISDDLSDTLSNSDYTVKNTNLYRVNDEEVILTFNRLSSPGIQTGIHCINVYDRNYFHFIIEVLPKIILSDKLKIPRSIPLLITADLPKSMKTFIQYYNKGNRDVYEIPAGKSMIVDKLHQLEDTSRILDVYNKPMSENGVKISSETYELLDPDKTVKNLGASVTFPKKIYLSRGKKIRSILNEGALVENLLKKGFAIINPEQLNTQNQIALFSQADVILAPTGAALTNLLWCKPKTKVIVLKSNHQNINLLFWQNIASSRMLDYCELSFHRSFIVTDKYAVHDSFYVDINDINKAL